MISQLYLHEPPSQKPIESSEEQWQFTRTLHRQHEEALNNVQGSEGVSFRSLITSMLPTDRNAVISPTTLLCSLLFLSEVCGRISKKEILRAICCHSAEACAIAENIRKCVTGNARLSECHIGNSLWVNNYAPIQEENLSAICKAHQVDAYMGEMGSDEINLAIQQWLNTNTGNVLKGHTSIQTDPKILFELFTASFFKAKWHDEFRLTQSKKDYFHVDSNTDVYCYFMNRNEHTLCNCGYQYTAVSKDMYMDYQMWFILPHKGVPLSALLSNNNVLKLLSNPSCMPLTEYDVAMSIPKFDIASDLDIKEVLQSMGIKALFSKDSTDASPVNQGVPLMLDKVKHISRVKITEDGVEAAAYAEYGMVAAGIAPKLKKLHFKADRPFLFAITKSNKVPLYVGTVYNPVEH